MLISSLMDSSLVDVGTHMDGKKEVLEKLVDLAEQHGMVTDRKTVLRSLLEREGMCSTAIGKGVAIPHPKEGLPGAFDGVAFSAVRIDGGLDLDAPDQKPVQLFFLVGAEDRREHLLILGKLARLLRNNDLREDLIGAQTSEEFVERLQAAEHSMNDSR